MKKFMVMALFMLVGYVIQAQDRPGPPSMEERMKRTMEIMQKEVQPSEKQAKDMEAAFKTFYTEAEKLRGDGPPPAPGQMDPKRKEAIDKLAKQRDESIKQTLTADQYKKYEETVANMRQRRPGGKPGEAPPPKQ
ncbi:MAG TPA: hypothetical protein VK166_19190 [Chitinophagaceae bacterium]|nr:hypothetical protein [Chitinophagaceae bacterium]